MGESGSLLRHNKTQFIKNRAALNRVSTRCVKCLNLTFWNVKVSAHWDRKFCMCFFVFLIQKMCLMRFWRSLVRWLWTVKTPLKMLATGSFFFFFFFFSHPWQAFLVVFWQFRATVQANDKIQNDDCQVHPLNGWQFNVTMLRVLIITISPGFWERTKSCGITR